MPTLADPLVALLESDNLHDPSPVYRWLRENEPVHWHEGLQTWVLTRHADCTAVLKDTRRFASDWRRIGEDVPDPLLSLQSLDPPEHTAVRRLVVNAIRAQDLRALERRVTESLTRRLAELEDRPFDFVGDLAAPLALETITTLLGVPAPDPAWFHPISTAIAVAMDSGLRPETYEAGVAARAQLAQLAASWLESAPEHGVIGWASAHLHEERVDPTVLHNSLRALLHAGYESVLALLANGLITLLDHPGALPVLATGAADRAIDELARYTTPVRADARACVVDAEIDGIRIEAGSTVTLLLGAANRDPARFPDPDTLDLSRAPNPHLAFGRGVHSCLGAALAVMQARVVFGTLARSYPHVRPVDTPVYRSAATIRGVERFDITLR
ncbi:MAG TPA: cytochrome P450 [Pseudonocardiaceae bacterium]